MTVLGFTIPFVNTPEFYTGTSATNLVPDVFPVALNGRPYMVDQRSGQFQRAFEPRVRDSVDQSTAPGEAAINPGGLWRRGEVSWHGGAGQRYADVAGSQDYRFWKSKGVNPWTKAQLSLLNDTKRSLESANTNLHLLQVNGYVYVSDGQSLKYTTDPFAATPSWTTVSTGALAQTINDIATDGRQIYVAYANNGIYMTTPGSGTLTAHYATSGTYNYTALGFAKGFLIGVHPDTSTTHVHAVPYAASTSHGSAVTTIRDPAFTCAGIAGGQNHIYIAGRGNDTGVVYRLGIKSDGTVDVAIVAFEHPVGEYPTGITTYLGYVILGTNKGVRFCSTDSSGNLVAGPLIPTSGDVNAFTAEGTYVWFGWSNYDGSSGGLGRLSITDFTSPNAPAYATDLMYGSNAAVLSAVTHTAKRVFTISGVGVIAEDSDNLVASGNIETGIYRWGIPDRKFVAKVDTRSLPLKGSIVSAMAVDGGSYATLGTWDSENDIENTFSGSDSKVIEAQFRYTLTRATATTGPTLTRWTARAYAAPFRSEVFRIPFLVHNRVRVHDKDYYFDPEEELRELQELVKNPRIVTLQIREETVPVIVEDLEWTPIDVVDWDWIWQGTATVTLRSTQE